MRKKKILFRIIFSIFFILLTGILSGICSAAADIEEEAEYSEKIEESVMGNFDFQEIDKVMEDLFPEEKLHLKDMVLAFEKGDIADALYVVKCLVKDRAAYAFRINKRNLVQILLLAIAAAVFTNFSSVFQNKQVSEISFYVLYLLLIAICLSSFQASVDWVNDGVDTLTTFMEVLGPVFFLAVAIARGSVTSVAFYNLMLLVIFIIELFVLKFLIPSVHVYIMVRVLNFLSGEDYLSKFAELIETLITWVLKTMLACMAGLQFIQGLIAPAIDALRRSAFTKGAEAIPGIGDVIGGVTEVVLGTAILVKNSIGIAGMIVCILLCVGPLVQMAVMVLMYKLAAAFVQPISDKRMVNCIESVGEGCKLLMRIIFTVGVLFLLTIAIAAASTGRV